MPCRVSRVDVLCEVDEPLPLNSVLPCMDAALFLADAVVDGTFFVGRTLMKQFIVKKNI
jgi:hypothetical protein